MNLTHLLDVVGLGGVVPLQHDLNAVGLGGLGGDVDPVQRGPDARAVVGSG